MNRLSTLVVLAVLAGVGMFAGGTTAAEPKADMRPRLVAQLGHSGLVVSAAFSPDGKQVLTSSYDKTARLWDATTGKEIRTFAGHTGEVIFASFSPDGRQVVTV